MVCGCLLAAWALHRTLCDRTRLRGRWADKRRDVDYRDWPCCKLVIAPSSNRALREVPPLHGVEA